MESTSPVIIPRKDSYSSVIHSDKVNSQITGTGDAKALKKSSDPPDGGFQVNIFLAITFALGLN